jgi:hypothetical protein
MCQTFTERVRLPNVRVMYGCMFLGAGQGVPIGRQLTSKSMTVVRGLDLNASRPAPSSCTRSRITPNSGRLLDASQPPAMPPERQILQAGFRRSELAGLGVHSRRVLRSRWHSPTLSRRMGLAACARCAKPNRIVGPTPTPWFLNLCAFSARLGPHADENGSRRRGYR